MSSARKKARPKHRGVQATQNIPVKEPITTAAPQSTYQDMLQWAFLIFVGILPLLSSPRISQINPSMTAQFLATLSFVGVWGLFWIYGWWSGLVTLRWPRWMWVVVLWLAAAVLAAFRSPVLAQGMLGSYSEWSDGVLFQAALFLIFWGVLSLPWTTKWIHRLMQILLIQAVGLLLKGLPEIIRLHTGFSRVQGPLYNSDYWIAYLLLVLPLLVWWLSVQGKVSGRWFKLAGGVVVAGLSINLLLALPSDLYRVIHVPLPTPAVTQNQGALSAVGYLQNPSNTERFSQWHMAIYLGEHHLLTGVGPGLLGSHTMDAANALHLTTWSQNVLMYHAHNDVLEEFGAKGVLGLGAYLALWITFFWLLVRGRKAVPAELRGMWYALIIAISLEWLFNKVFFVIIPTGVLLWTWLAIALVVVRADGRRQVPVISWFKPLALVVSGALLYALGSIFYLYQAEQYTSQAMSAENSQDYLPMLDYANHASELVPYEAVYARYAAWSAFSALHGDGNLSTENRDLFVKVAIAKSRQALRYEPFQPIFALEAAVYSYDFSQAGSSDEQSAHQRIQDALARSDRFAYLYSLAGDGYVWKGNLTEAEAMFRKAAQLEPTPARQQRLQDFLKYKAAQHTA